MAKTDTLNIRIEPKLKKDVEKTLDDLGMNIADAVTVFLKQVVLTESIPFAIRKPKFSDENDMMKNPEKYEAYDNIDEVREGVNKDE